MRLKFMLLLILSSTMLSYNVLSFLHNKLNQIIKMNSISSFQRISKMAIMEEAKGDQLEYDKEVLQQLRLELEEKRLAYVANELAIKKLETKLFKNSTITIKNYSTYNDYGFNSKFNDKLGTVPMSAIKLSFNNFQLELSDILKLFKSNTNDNQDEDYSLELRRKLNSLKLSNQAIWDRENNRTQITAPYVIKIPYLVLCTLLDTLFDGKPINRFYFLETVARMPYFSYITMLHTYETLGWWRRSSEAKRIHFAEELNEYNHLLIMESLGGSQDWIVRFLAQHASIVYYFVLIVLWIISPSLAYNFSELIEAHAVDTYTEFAESNKEILQSMIAPKVAKDYYESPDMYVFDEFQTNKKKGSRRPIVNSLYDVFCNIVEDESSHVSTMSTCQDPEVVLKSPNTEAAIISTILAISLVTYFSYNALNQDLDILDDVTSMKVVSETSNLVKDNGIKELLGIGEQNSEETSSILSKLFEIISKFRL